MSLSLSSAELRAMQRAIRLLSAPLDCESVDAWRAAVNACMRELFSADTAGFLLPETGTQLFYSEEHDPDEIGRYPDYHPPSRSDGRNIFEHMVGQRVCTMRTAYGDEIARYLDSPYYNEYAAPNGACDTLAAMVPIGGFLPRDIGSVHVWRNASHNARFGDREIKVCQILYPALQAGIETYLHLGKQCSRLFATCDALGQAIGVYDTTGRVAHKTPALQTMLDEDSDRSLALEIDRMVGALRAAFQTAPGAELPSPLRVEVSTASARYIVRGSHHHAPGERTPALLVSIERSRRARRSTQDIQRTFGLTPAESRVAVLLAEGRPNAAIAEALGISAATARRHTEKIFWKLSVRTRAEAAARLAA